MGKNSWNHVIKDNTICDIRVRHSGGEVLNGNATFAWEGDGS